MKAEQSYIETNIELTQSQLLLWMGQKLNPNSPMYNMAHSFEIKGAINETVFKKSFQDLIDSIDVFRIIFKEEKGEAHYVWFLNIHHLVTDATSSTILFENFTKIYQKNLEAQSEISSKIPQYRDYLEFEKKATKDIDKDSVRKYWKDTASKVTAPPILYGQNPKEITSLSNRITIKLGADRIAILVFQYLFNFIVCLHQKNK